MALLALPGLAVARTAVAQEYPTRPITYLMPFAGGSASDVVSRIMLDKMSKSMGRPIIVDNGPGAGGNTGTAAGAKATPDGLGPVAANVTLYKTLGYDPLRDMEIISPFAGSIIVVASSTLPVKSLKELIALAKAEPENSIMDRWASAARSIWRASISRSSPTPGSTTCPIATSRSMGRT